MNHSQLPGVVRATAAALAVFMTMATLDFMFTIAEPQQTLLLTQTALRAAKQASATPKPDVIVAQAPDSASRH